MQSKPLSIPSATTVKHRIMKLGDLTIDELKEFIQVNLHTSLSLSCIDFIISEP